MVKSPALEIFRQDKFLRSGNPMGQGDGQDDLQKVPSNLFYNCSNHRSSTFCVGSQTSFELCCCAAISII